jgi:hypothetical protein
VTIHDPLRINGLPDVSTEAFVEPHNSSGAIAQRDQTPVRNTIPEDERTMPAICS